MQRGVLRPVHASSRFGNGLPPRRSRRVWYPLRPAALLAIPVPLATPPPPPLAPASPVASPAEPELSDAEAAAQLGALTAARVEALAPLLLAPTAFAAERAYRAWRRRPVQERADLVRTLGLAPTGPDTPWLASPHAWRVLSAGVHGDLPPVRAVPDGHPPPPPVSSTVREQDGRLLLVLLRHRTAVVPPGAQARLLLVHDLAPVLLRRPTLSAEAMLFGVAASHTLPTVEALAARPDFPETAALAYAQDWAQGATSRRDLPSRTTDGAIGLPPLPEPDPRLPAVPECQYPRYGHLGRRLGWTVHRAAHGTVPAAALLTGLLRRPTADLSAWTRLLATAPEPVLRHVGLPAQQLTPEQVLALVRHALSSTAPAEFRQQTTGTLRSLLGLSFGGPPAQSIAPLAVRLRHLLLWADIRQPDASVVREILAGPDLGVWSPGEVAAWLAAADRPLRLAITARLAQVRGTAESPERAGARRGTL